MAEIRYRFVASGQDDVLRVFRGIAEAAKRAAKEQKDSAVARKPAQDGAKAEAQRQRETLKTQLLQQKVSQQAAAFSAKEAQAAQKSASQRIQAEERVTQARIKTMRMVSQEADRLSAKDVRHARNHERERQRANDRARRGEYGAAKSIVGIAGAIGTAGMVAGGAAAAGLGLIARDRNALQEQANRIAISGRGAGQQAIDPSVLRREFEKSAIAVPGTKASDVARGVGAFVSKTGDLNTARKFSKTFAVTSAASGADLEDVANASAALREKFGITEEKDLQSALAALTFQGKAGSFEIKDAAGLYDKLTAAGQRFGMDKGVEGVRTLGGLTQLARSSTGSSEQAAFAVEAMLRQLVSKSGDIKDEFGVDVFTDKSQTKARDIQSLVVDVISGAKGNLPALQKVFGEEGIRGVSPMISEFNRAAQAAGKNATEAQRMAAGQAAVRAMFDRTINAAGDWSEVQKDAAQASQDASAKLTAAWEMTAARLGEALVPAVEGMAVLLEGIEGPVSYLGDMLLGASESASEFGTNLVRLLQKAGVDIGNDTSPDAIKRKRGELSNVDRDIEKLDGKGKLIKLSKREEYRLARLKEKQTKLREDVGLGTREFAGGEGGTTDLDKILGGPTDSTNRPTYDWGPESVATNQKADIARGVKGGANAALGAATMFVNPQGAIDAGKGVLELVNGFGEAAKGAATMTTALGQAARQATTAADALKSITKPPPGTIAPGVPGT